MNIGNLAKSVRRNHGLEHATIHLLSRKYPLSRFSGHSDTGGFWLFGDVLPEDLEVIVADALKRLNNGERGLAIHPNCGTNLLSSGFGAALGAWIAIGGVGKKSKGLLQQFPLMVMFASIGLLLSTPLGPYLQKNYTTTGEMGDLKIHKITISSIAGKIAHRVVTVQSHDK